MNVLYSDCELLPFAYTTHLLTLYLRLTYADFTRRIARTNYAILWEIRFEKKKVREESDELKVKSIKRRQAEN